MHARRTRIETFAAAVLLAGCLSRCDGTVMSGSGKLASAEDKKAPPAEAGSDDDKNNDDLHVVTPEAAYLTCAAIDVADTSEDLAHFGCAAFYNDGQRATLKDVKTKWSLKNTKGEDVPAEEVKIAARDEDVIWRLERAVLVQGVSGELAVLDASGAPKTGAIRQKAASSKAGDSPEETPTSTAEVTCKEDPNRTSDANGKELSVVYVCTPANTPQDLTLYTSIKWSVDPAEAGVVDEDSTNVYIGTPAKVGATCFKVEATLERPDGTKDLATGTLPTGSC